MSIDQTPTSGVGEVLWLLSRGPVSPESITT
ncbi:hypothetical protein BH11GEM1_BH11GEM1_34730 [soil metagenome]